MLQKKNMFTKVIFKRLLPASILYVVSVQLYMVDHILRSGQTRIIPQPTSLSNKTLAKREKLLQDIFDILQMKPSVEKFEWFTENATLEDPSISFVGRTSIINGLTFMSMMLEKSETLKMHITHTKSTIFVDSVQRYTFPLFGQVNVPQLVSLELVEDEDGNEKVERMTEEWNSKPLLTHENAPVLYVGLTSSLMRKMYGKMF